MKAKNWREKHTTRGSSKYPIRTTRCNISVDLIKVDFSFFLLLFYNFPVRLLDPVNLLHNSLITNTAADICNRCGKNSILTDGNIGERFCSKCGLVVTDKILDTGAEWRSFSNDEGNKARTGAGTSLTMHDMGLSTVIGAANKDATGKPLSASVKSSIERLRTWDSRSKAKDSVDRNLRQALMELSNLKDKLSLSASVNEKAAYIYRKALEKKLVRGRSISALIAASLYAACRNTETPRTLNDISTAGNLKRKDVARCYRLLHIENWN